MELLARTNMMAQKTKTRNDPLTRSQSVFVGRREAEKVGDRRNRSHSVFVISEDEEIGVDLNDLINDLEDNTNKHSCIDRSRSLTEKELKELLARKNMKTRRATVMITTGALTFIVLAATLVTVSLLLSPIIEELFGRFMFIFIKSTH